MGKTESRIKPFLASIIFLLGVILLPYAYQETIGLGSANHIIRWPLWIYIDSFYKTGFSLISVGEVLSFIPYWTLRFLLVYWIFRYYSGISTRNHLFAIGIISEIPSLVFSLITLTEGATQPNGFSTFVLPIPALFILTLLLVYLLPPHAKQDSWLS